MKSMSNENFWLEEPCVLFTSFAIVPTASMTKNEKLNALTRLTILITIILYIIGWPYWLYFLLIMLIIILLLKYVPAGNKEQFTMLSTTPLPIPTGGHCNTHVGGCNDQKINISSTGLSSPGTLAATPYETVIDGSAQMIDEGDVYIDDNTTNVDDMVLLGNDGQYCEEVPQRLFGRPSYCRQYGQSSYHTRTELLLPSTQLQFNCMQSGSNNARCIANRLYTADSIKYRAGLEFDYQRALNRRNKRCNSFCPTFN